MHEQREPKGSRCVEGEDVMSGLVAFVPLGGLHGGDGKAYDFCVNYIHSSLSLATVSLWRVAQGLACHLREERSGMWDVHVNPLFLP